MRVSHKIVMAIVLASLLALLLPSLVARAQGDAIVRFPDANLEAAVREAIGRPTGDIHQSHVEGLTSLSAEAKGIIDLRGLEYCTSLTQLDLSRNPINDISPLSSLTSLSTLHLWRNQISDVSALSNLTGLTWLHLGVNQISDISPLVENSGLGNGDTVIPGGNPLSTTSVNVRIPQLQRRGVDVRWGSAPTPTAIYIIAGALGGLVLLGLLMQNPRRRRREDALLISRYREKLDEWEQEGYDVSEFRKRWFG